jgi:uncharacterized protein YjiS (DUF1127 family)
MSAVQILEAQRFRLPRMVRQIATTLKALGAWASKSQLARGSSETHWRSLDERLLRDIGISPAEAEMARLEARMGVAATDVREGAGYTLPEADRLGGSGRSDIAR